MLLRTCASGSVALLLAACGTVRPAPPVPSGPDIEGRATQSAPAQSRPLANVPAPPPAGSGRGGYYLDDGPGEAPPPNLAAVPDAIPKIEPYAARGNKPYVVFGKTYTPITDNQPLKQRGMGSWYGKKFHGQKTSSGELYDMYKMTAAHPTLPIPSYARVTNVKNGTQVIVRVNDRGPFHSSRIIDLSYTAALKLGYIGHGSTELDVERLLPDEIARINAQARNPVLAARSWTPPPVTAALPPVPAAVGAPTDAVSLENFLKTQASTPVLANGSAPVSRMSANGAAQGMPIALAADSAFRPPDQSFVQLPANAAPWQGSSSLPASSSATAMATTAVAIAEAAIALPPSPPSTSPASSPLPSGLASDDPGAVLAAGFYLQFGAYSRVENATQLRRQLLPRWPVGLPLPEVRQNGTLFRLFSGPYSGRDAAEAAAGQVGVNPQARALIVRR